MTAHPTLLTLLDARCAQLAAVRNVSETWQRYWRQRFIRRVHSITRTRLLLADYWQRKIELEDVA